MFMSWCQLIVTTWFQCVKTLLWVPMGSQIRHLWPRWPSPSVLACLNLNLTQGHPLAKFSNMRHFRHFLRASRKTWPKSTGLPWQILQWVFRPNFRGEFLYRKKIVHGRPIRVGCPCLTDFFRIGQNSDFFFWKLKR